MTLYAQDIIDQALDMVEMENAYGTASFAIRDRVQDWFNKGLSRLHYAIANADNTWFNESATIPVTAATARYALPDGTLYSSAKPFYKMNDLAELRDGRNYSIKKFQRPELDGWKATGPQSSATLTMLYTPAYVPIARGDWTAAGTHDEIPSQYPPGFEDYVACFIAKRLAIRDADYERFQALSEEGRIALAEVMERAAVRDQHMPETVIDVSDRWTSSQWLRLSADEALRYRLFGDYLELGQPDPLP